MRPRVLNRTTGMLAGLVALVGISIAIFLYGLGGRSGWLSSADQKSTPGESNRGKESADGNHGHSESGAADHVDISAAAAGTLGLRLQVIDLQPYVKTLHIPAEVIEKPGQSGRSVTSPVQGIVTKIHRFPGQSLEPGDPLVTLRVADEALEAAQLSLLDILTKISVTELEIERLNPLAESGAIVGRRKLELEYQLKQLESERSARLQELKLRGLADVQVSRIVQHRELISEIEVRLETPASGNDLAATAANSTRLISSENGESHILTVAPSSTPSGPIFTLEQLDVFPGRRVLKGEELCHIANHTELFLRGHAFESDVVAVSKSMNEGRSVTAETGLEDSRTEIRDLTIAYIDNHVDKDSQTFPFYLPLPNRVLSEQMDQHGRVFRSWQFKPGQRAHLFVPLETWADQIVLPRDAVVRSGPESYVFRLASSNPFERRLNSAQRLARLEKTAIWELEPVKVQLYHQDRTSVVIARDGDLGVGDLVVVNRAYQVYLAWRLQSAVGGGHDHHHH